MPVRELIAIVGRAGRFPGSGADLAAFWKNIVERHDCGRPVPEGRWSIPSNSLIKPQGPNADTIEHTRSYSLDPFEPDLTDLAIDRGLVSSLDPLFQLVLDVGGRAWRSFKNDNTDRRKVGVILGNICLPTDSGNALARECLGGKLADVMGRPRPPKTTHHFNHFVAGLPAGLLAKSLGLGLNSFTLDAACASSLYAIKLAADELLAGRANVMLAGGCSRPDSLYTQMGFSQLRALSPTGICSPFDAAANGLVVGEGAGIFVLKRLSDAIADGDMIHAVLHGAGLSNDTSGNLLAPASEGQLRAMRQAYENAQWDPSDVELIECHATGTPVGDAIEFDALSELWKKAIWNVGQCVIGSVKSTVGHLLTGAGAAALMKVLLAFEHKTLPPQTNFKKSIDTIEIDGSPFRVLTNAEPWISRSEKVSRKAAVSGFGFGGVNAHLLFADRPTAEDKPDLPVTEPVKIAIVGMASQLGGFENVRDVIESNFRGTSNVVPRPKTVGWDLAENVSPAGHFINELSVPLDRYRIPPKELEAMLPQQLAALQVAWDALDDVKSADGLDGSRIVTNRQTDHRSGVFLGVTLDPNTTNFHLRWSTKEKAPDLADSASPPLTADRTMGALASCAASRIAKSLQWGGPAFTVCAEDASGGRALELAVRALQNGELDRALAGAVEFTGDPRTIAAIQKIEAGNDVVRTDGAAAVVLKRLSDAEKNGDRVYAVITAVGSAVGGTPETPGPDAKTVASSLIRTLAEAKLAPNQFELLETSHAPNADVAVRDALTAFESTSQRHHPLSLSRSPQQIGHAGATSFFVSLISGAASVYHHLFPPTDHAAARFWLTNAPHSRRTVVLGTGVDGSVICALLEEYAKNRPQPIEARSRASVERRQPLGLRSEALFAIEFDTTVDANRKIDDLLAQSATFISVERLARVWHSQNRLDPRRTRALTLVPRSIEELRDQLAFAKTQFQSNPDAHLASLTAGEMKWRDRIFHTAKPLGRTGKIAYVFPGSGNHFAGMGQMLGTAFPEILRRQQSENESLLDQFAGPKFWRDRLSSDTTPAECLFAQVAVGALHADLLQSFGIKPDAMLGFSLGESAGLFGLRIWRHRDEMQKRIRQSTLFHTDLAPPYHAAQQFFGWSNDNPVDWVVGVISVDPDGIRSKLRPGLKAYLLMIIAPNECVIGGLRDDVTQLAQQCDARFIGLEGVTLAHCEVPKPVQKPYRDLHFLPVTPVSGLRVYSGAWGRAYHPTDSNAADSITAGLLNVIDVPNVINAAYRDGVRIFLEVGPGGSATRSVTATLAERPFVARTVSAARQNDVSLLLRLVAHLISERVPVDLGLLYGRETVCVGHQEKPLQNQNCVYVPVGLTAQPLPFLLPIGDPESSVLRRSLIQSISADLQDFPAPPQEWTAHDSAAGIAAAAAAEFPHNDSPHIVVDSDDEAIMRSPIPKATSTPPPIQSSVELIAPIDRSTSNSASSIVVSLPDSTSDIPIADPLVAAAATALTATLESGLTAHRTFLNAQQHAMTTTVEFITRHDQWLRQALGYSPSTNLQTSFSPPPSDHVPRSLTTEQCFEFARGKIGNVLGARFSAIDAHPTRVRLPDDELMLVDRVVTIEGEPLSMTRGRVVTEHTVHAQRWYLDSGVCPTSVTVESGQADLFLSGFLGIDMQTKGLAVYRLLDAVVSFHRGLPKVGETIVYDIHIDEFFRQADSWLFRFRFEGTINGQPMLSMKNGVAGFFTNEALNAGKGIIHTKLDRMNLPGKVPDGWTPFVRPRLFSLDAEAVRALRDGDYEKAFGPEFGKPPLRNPMRLPGGKLRLIDRVPMIDHTGGRFGLGMIRAEYDIDPKDWFLTCHFVDDRVMPGTLMYECCLHTLRTLVMSMGWVGEADRIVCEPVPGIQSRLKCRGQVIESTKLVTYEVSIKEIGVEPNCFAIADALMYADGKPIVEITNMSLRLTGMTVESLKAIWPSRKSVAPKPTLYDSAKILAYSNGKPSEAFGEPYKIFDHDRVIARLPGPPFQFLDRVTAVTGEPFVLKAGAACETEYHVSPDAWYFAENRSPNMPFSVLLEIALQPCGWLAAYCGSALTSSSDLSFRNLGGKATQFRAVTPQTGLLTINVIMTSVSQSAGMIIQHYEMTVKDSVGVVYQGTTYFGFFGKEALKNQVGMPQAKVPFPTEAESLRAESTVLPDLAPFPAPQMRMIDQIPQFIPDGGKAGLGLIVGTVDVEPSFWFFKAHFYQDPVWPGSLGLESFLQLLKYVAWRRFGEPSNRPWQTVALNAPHEWTYRGQVVPTDSKVTVVLEITAVDIQKRRLTADGFLIVDGRIIYQMRNFTLD